MRGRRRARGARSARERETCRGRTEPRRCPPAQRERFRAVSAHFLPFALLLPDVAGKQNTRWPSQALRAADALARRVCLQHTHGRRATHLRGPARAGRRGSSRSAPPSGGEQALPACEWDVRAEAGGKSSVPVIIPFDCGGLAPAIENCTVYMS